MEKNFILVKTRTKERGLSVEVILQVLELIEYAEDNDVELYMLGGKLRMRYTGPVEKKDKGKSDFGLDDLMGMFGMKK